MEKINTLFITVNSSPYGGSSIQMSMLARDLVNFGYNSYLLYKYLPNNTYSENFHKEMLNNPNIFVESYHSEPKIIIDLVKTHQIDLVYCHMHITPLVINNIKGYNIPIIVYYGTSSSLNKEEINAIRDPNVKAIISVSNGGARYLHSILSDSEHSVKEIIVIRQGTELYFSEREENRLNQIIDQDKLLILSVASMLRYKGLDYFVKIVISTKSKIDNVIGAVIGKIDMPLMKEISERTGENIIKMKDKKIIKTGPILFPGPTKYVGNWIQRSNIVICTSTDYEGIPGSLREALLCGKPVITFDVGYVKELFHEEGNWSVVKQGDISNMVRNAITYFKNPKVFKAKIIREQRFASSLFSQRKRVKKYISLFNRILRNEGGVRNYEWN